MLTRITAFNVDEYETNWCKPFRRKTTKESDPLSLQFDLWTDISIIKAMYREAGRSKFYRINLYCVVGNGVTFYVTETVFKWLLEQQQQPKG